MKRDVRIDILRVLGTFLIILAHVYPPGMIFEVRSFDVPLMAILLGMSFVKSTENKKNERYRDYLIKRFKRLVIPTWVFVTLFIISVYIGAYIFSIELPYTWITIASSYALLSGVGYVWIIRVFFTIAIVSPILFKIATRVNKMHLKICLITVLLIIQQILCVFLEKFDGKIQLLVEQLIAISFGYTLLALIGMWCIMQTKKENLIFLCYTAVVFVISGTVSGFPLLNDQKYPPTAYFISYGILISLLLFFAISEESIARILDRKIVSWISTHSLELYFWHIFPATFLEMKFEDWNWVIKYLIVLVISFLITRIQTEVMPGLFSLNFNRKNKVKI